MFVQSYLIVSCLSQEFHQLFSSCSYNFPLLGAPLSLSKPFTKEKLRILPLRREGLGYCGSNSSRKAQFG